LYGDFYVNLFFDGAPLISRGSQTLARSKTFRGELASGRDIIVPRACIRRTSSVQTMMQIRIGGEAPGRRAHSLVRLEAKPGFGSPPPRIVNGA
jgi:hypothetical protein